MYCSGCLVQACAEEHFIEPDVAIVRYVELGRDENGLVITYPDLFRRV